MVHVYVVLLHNGKITCDLNLVCTAGSHEFAQIRCVHEFHDLWYVCDRKPKGKHLICIRTVFGMNYVICVTEESNDSEVLHFVNCLLQYKVCGGGFDAPIKVKIADK